MGLLQDKLFHVGCITRFIRTDLIYSESTSACDMKHFFAF